MNASRAVKDMTEKNRTPAPECATYEEEAAFWDNHDVTAHWDEFKPVRARFARNLSEGIHVRLVKETLDSLTAVVGMHCRRCLWGATCRRPLRAGRCPGPSPLQEATAP
jgi:hypothetical protein